ncbi:EF-P lysine aminoacylase EpmA [Thiohalobacter thiocyanaticus]|uniref:EF-P lysine aminoacylase GenX n=1 Tax=Thiohalobacter thiocyanaticus TaxID=585455 RepID=A0A426QH65_9GAMM|nr:EF-P lysine aminoacylase EpmA [Thiohalobacter thiocyanaticus]RRQ21099.1 EF-P lysine aminoacylase GenX [Thiohalobacter thiocyanaticus]
MNENPWQPAAGLDVLRLRAELLTRIRAFFAERDVLEVETPLLSHAGLPTPQLESFAAHPASRPETPTGYLHTSPEFPMKRLLAAGSGPIYQICKVFRADECGRRHNPEFTLLEWYRVGFDAPALMTEVETLLESLFDDTRPVGGIQRLSYREAFLQYAGVDGLEDAIAPLRWALDEHAIPVPDGMPADDPDPWRDLLLTQVIEPRLPPAVFLYDYPASQAALARIRPGRPPVAERFELYLDGVEIANGFHELTDAVEQRRRFEAENARRIGQGLAPVPLDEHLLAALEHGLPDCAGVAVGLDRLLMRTAGVEDIDAVLAFPWERA